MRGRSRARVVPMLLGALGMVAAGCDTSRGRATPITTAAAPTAEIAAAASAAPSSREAAAPPRALPERFASLGEPCEGSPIFRRGPFVEICGTSATVAAVAGPVDMVRGIPPAQAEVLTSIKQPSYPLGREQETLVVAREAQRLWVALVTCGGCRRIRGTSVVADLDQLGAEGVAALQRMLHLPEEPKLATVDDWRHALEGEVGAGAADADTH